MRRSFTSPWWVVVGAVGGVTQLLVPLDLERGAIVEPRIPVRTAWATELRVQRFALVVASVWLLVVARVVLVRGVPRAYSS